MKTVTARVIETDFPSFLQQVENGEEVTITKDGHPIARLLPAASAGREKFKLAIERLKEFRASNPSKGLDWEELKKFRDEGKK
jgi:prevent-host-death family protein